MVVVDSAVWIDYFNGKSTPACVELVRLLSDRHTRIVVPDLVLYEVLRGFRHERDHRDAKALLLSLSIEYTGGAPLAMAAAQHYRDLRSLGLTVRSSIDVLVASYCIEHDYLLLHQDRDYKAFVKRFGLRQWSQ